MLNATLNTYIIWNIDLTECFNFGDLQALEASTGHSHSSVITTGSIEAVKAAFMNEASVTLGFIATPNR